MARRQTGRQSARKDGGTRRAVVIALLILFALYFYQSGMLDRLLQQMGLQTTTGSQTRQSSGDVRVIFTTPSLVYPDRRNQRPASPLLNAVIADIDAGKTSVIVAVFDLDVTPFVDALLRARQRGLTVRVIVDSENLETPEVSQQTGRLEAAGVGLRFDDREPFMHHKFVVVDQAIAWIGSWNITENDTFRNNNNMLRFAGPEIAADYTREFDQMFAGVFGTRKQSNVPNSPVQLGAARVQALFSPQDGVQAYVLQRLDAAQTSVRFLTFSYTADPIAEAMIAKAGAGVTVQGVFESQNANGSGSEYNRLRRGGISVFEDGNCYIMHHKIIIIDNQTVLTGSYNFTGSAERDNDENLVIIDDPVIARQYVEEFERVYAQAQNPSRCN
jgi:phosphatidylserine/phosphatidylglycerophosphate/cardiolipin synthase-like enzyme